MARSPPPFGSQSTPAMATGTRLRKKVGRTLEEQRTACQLVSSGPAVGVRFVSSFLLFGGLIISVFLGCLFLSLFLLGGGNTRFSNEVIKGKHNVCFGTKPRVSFQWSQRGNQCVFGCCLCVGWGDGIEENKRYIQICLCWGICFFGYPMESYRKTRVNDTLWVVFLHVRPPTPQNEKETHTHTHIRDPINFQPTPDFDSRYLVLGWLMV